MSDQGDSAPPQWAPDPTGRHRHRYWDGSGWTGHVYDGIDPPRRAPRPRPEAPTEHQPEPYAAGAGAAAGGGAAAGAGAGAYVPAPEEEEPVARRGRGSDANRQSFWKGAIVGGVAVAAIALLAWLAFGGKDNSVSTTVTTRHKSTTTTSSLSTTTLLTTSTVAGRPPSQVRVVVQNASGTGGAAGTKATALKAAGYNVVGTGNAATRTGTVVECKTGFENEANALAAAVGGNATTAPFPTPAPSGTTNADCLVIIGK